VALARKLAHVLYALWKHHTAYDPVRGARPWRLKTNKAETADDQR
jgi:hypothetical protein